MAINKTINSPSKSKAGMRNCIEYVLKAEKTDITLTYMTGPAPDVLNWNSVYQTFMTEKEVNDITYKYEQKKNAIYGVTTGAVIYGFVISAYKMLSSVRMRSDLSAFFKGIYCFIVSVIVNNKELLIEIWSPKDNAENSAGSIAVHIALTILLIAIQLVISGFVGWGVYVLSKWAYYSDMFDFVMVMVMLISMASIVWIADKLTFISWNLVLVWIIIQLGIIMTRVTVEYFLI